MWSRQSLCSTWEVRGNILLSLLNLLKFLLKMSFECTLSQPEVQLVPEGSFGALPLTPRICSLGQKQLPWQVNSVTKMGGDIHQKEGSTRGRSSKAGHTPRTVPACDGQV